MINSPQYKKIFVTLAIFGIAIVLQMSYKFVTESVINSATSLLDLRDNLKQNKSVTVSEIKSTNSYLEFKDNMVPNKNVAESEIKSTNPLLDFTNNMMANKSVADSVINTTDPHQGKNTIAPELNITKRLPGVIIIGMGKCGTYALNVMMGMHSKIVSTSDKKETEVAFFNQEDHYKKGLQWYRNRMPYSYEDQITLEKSPRYGAAVINGNIKVPKRMKAMNSSLHLIMLVKDPVTRSLSHYAWFKYKYKKLKNFEYYAFHPDGEVNSRDDFIRLGLYEKVLQAYLKVFSRKQILVLDGDLLIKNPLQVLKKVEEFLNLEPEITQDYFIYNKEKGFYCLKNNIKGCFPEYKKGKGFYCSENSKQQCLPKRKGCKHPEIDENRLKKLRSFFAPYNKRFYDLVGHNFDWET